MQRKLEALRRSDDEAVKEAGLLVDFDEVSRKGKMSAEEGQVAKWYGVYSARQAGNFMLRVVIPGGLITSAQARTLAKVAGDYAQGRVAFTTRQSAQLHWVKLPMLPEVMRDLATAGLSTFHGCGDVTRNVAACQWASTCPYRRMDVMPYARETAAVMTDSRDLDNLPRKFKITFSGCGAGCAQPHMNCIGVVAVKNGFSVMIGGGLGWSPMVGKPLYGYVPPNKISALCRAIGIFYRDFGDRYDRTTSRLKYVVKRLGIDRCREEIAARFKAEGHDPAVLRIEAEEDAGDPWPERPLVEPNPVGTDGRAMFSAKIPNGELKHEQLERLAELSEIYGDKYLRTTNRQNLEIHGVEPGRVGDLAAEVKKIGFDTEGFFGLTDIVSCVGTKYCPLAVAKTHDLVDLLKPLAHEERFAAIHDAVLMNVCGCPNACSPYHISDIGFRGMRIRENEGSVEGYQIWLGGTESRYGEVLGEYKLPDCVYVVKNILEKFTELRQGKETLADCVQRVGLDPFRVDIKYEMAPSPQEFSVIQGEATAKLDEMTMAKDVPCQHACPAGTDVPEYIRQVALGNHDAAYRLNQEANVFPGVLGRVCTRPCEPACRHQWTGAQGPVAICHIKRTAADERAQPADVLPPWFPDSGRHVAVIGGGPAGLSAARELKRYGHRVTIYESEKFLGGMMRYGIPVFRLPRQIVEEEVKAITDSGIETRLGERIESAGVKDLVSSHDAVLMAVGATRPQTLELDGLAKDVGLGGLHFVRSYNVSEPPPLEPDVVVIGGGFTAIDCARIARRVLGENGKVHIMYRRTEGQMSASPDEMWQVRMEGIDVETLATPVGARCSKDGKLEAVIFQRNKLEPAEGAEKPPITAIPGTEFEVPCSTLIFAIGQSRTLEVLPDGAKITGESTTSQEKLFVAGDFSTGSLDVIHAVAAGKSAADAIDEYLMGKVRRKQKVRIEPVEETGRLRDYDLTTPPKMPVLAVGRRNGNAEVETGLDPEAGLENAQRCYLCDLKFEIDQDLCIHCDWCIKVSPRDCIRRLTRLFNDKDGSPTGYVETSVPAEATYIWIDSDQCIRCGNCHRICPTEAISLRKCSLFTESQA